MVNQGFSQALVQKSKQVTEEDASTIFYVNLAWGIFIYGVLYFSAPLIASFYKQPVLIDIARILFVVVIINSLSVVARAKLTINIDFKSQAIVSTITTIIGSAVGLYAALKGYSYWSLVAMIITKSVCSCIGIWLFCRWMPKLIFSIASFKALFKFGSNLMLAGVVATFVNNLYIALIGRYFSSAAVGFYTQANNWSSYFYTFISSSLQGVTYPIMTSIKEDRGRLVSIYKQLISITMLVSLPILVGLAAVADNVILLLLGEEWLPAVPLLVALCLARTVTPISAINMNILNALGRSDLFLKVDLSKLPLTLGALFLALPYGIEAIAWASVVTSFIAFFINAYFPGKFFNIGGFTQLRMAWKYVVAAILMFFVVKEISLDALLPTLMAQVCIGGAVYFSIVALLRDDFFCTQARDILNKVVNKNG